MLNLNDGKTYLGTASKISFHQETCIKENNFNKHIVKCQMFR